jgi:hypothetical protein
METEQQWPTGLGFVYTAAKIEGQTAICVSADDREKTYRLIDGTTRTLPLFTKVDDMERVFAEREFRAAAKWPPLP